MNKEEILKAIAEGMDAIKAGANFATKEQLEEKFKAVKNYDDTELKAKFDELVKAVEAQGLEIAKSMDSKGKSNKSVTDYISDNIEPMEKAIESGAKFRFEMPLKTVTASSLTSDTSGIYNDNVVDIFRGSEFLRNIFTKRSAGNNSHGTYYWWEQLAITDNSSNVSEGADAASESTLTWVQKSISGKRINAWSKATKDQLKDVVWMRDQLITTLSKTMRLKENSGLWNGTGSTTYLAGITTYATAFSTASSPTYKYATLQDLVGACKVQIARDTYSGATATHVCLSPNRVDEIRSEKDELGNYINQAWALGGTITINGLTVVENALISDDQMLVGDMRLAQLIEWDNLMVEVGQIDDDFTNGIYTINAYIRENLVVADNDKGAFVYVSDIDSAIEAINENEVTD